MDQAWGSENTLGYVRVHRRASREKCQGVMLRHANE